MDAGASTILETVPSGVPGAPETPPARPAAATPTSVSGASPTNGPSDPFDEAPGAVWYVRPATGGQFGPASAAIMRSWIKEGRVGASSLIWRAGWEDWQQAANIFPQLATPASTPAKPPGMPPVPNVTPATPVGQLPMGQAVQTIAPAPTASGSEADGLSTVALSRGMRKKRRNNDLRLISSAILLVISIILVAVLIWIARRQSTPAESESVDAPPASDVSSAIRADRCVI
jgi:hypothetical protein